MKSSCRLVGQPIVAAAGFQPALSAIIVIEPARKPAAGMIACPTIHTVRIKRKVELFSTMDSARMRVVKLATLLFFALVALIALGQDTRTVTEPAIPAVCQTLQGNGRIIDESNLDTKRIQDAIDHCMTGQAVRLRGGAFVSGPLQLRSGVTLLIDATLYASRNPRDFDIDTPGRCGTVDKRGRGCRPLISGDGVENAAVMGDGVIDGRGGATLVGSRVSWWDLAQEAKVKNENQNCPRLIVISKSKNFTLYRIALKNSPNFHVTFNGDGFTAWGVVIESPKTSRNTDGIDPVNATNVTITHCHISTGDDQVAIKAGGAGPSGNMTIAHNRFYTGHGMSIGSETDGGASAIRVTDLSIDGADNGLRIKSNETRGGAVKDVVYEDVCIQNTKNPIFMDSNYTASVDKVRGKYPMFTGIVLRDVRVLTPGKITLDGFDAAHRLEMTFDGVTLAGAAPIAANHGVFTMGPGPVNFTPSGDDVRVTGKGGNAKSKSCSAMFEPMPKR
jgi:polygalacturonase